MSGPILSKSGGYPNNVFPGSGLDIINAADAKAVVDRLVTEGASVISVSLEGGGEGGAPWMKHDPVPANGWPVMSDAELEAIVHEAHHKGVKVAAYLGDQAGAEFYGRAAVPTQAECRWPVKSSTPRIRSCVA